MGKVKEEIGNKYGRLTVVKRAGLKKRGCKKLASWYCLCDCGNPKLIEVIGTDLRTGDVKSCGCLAAESIKSAKKRNLYDIIDNYVVGFTSKGEKFYFDLDDFEKVKKYCWHIDSEGYVTTNTNRSILRMHVLVMETNNSNLYVDHIHGKNTRNDNRKENLRIVTNQQNAMNQSLRKNNTSGVTGVNYEKQRGLWRARIKVNYKNIELGYYENKEDAIQARREAEEKYFGEYSYTNSQNFNVKKDA